jgi:hypothetical protein
VSKLQSALSDLGLVNDVSTGMCPGSGLETTKTAQIGLRPVRRLPCFGISTGHDLILIG